MDEGELEERKERKEKNLPCGERGKETKRKKMNKRV